MKIEIDRALLLHCRQSLNGRSRVPHDDYPSFPLFSCFLQHRTPPSTPGASLIAMILPSISSKSPTMNTTLHPLSVSQARHLAPRLDEGEGSVFLEELARTNSQPDLRLVIGLIVVGIREYSASSTTPLALMSCATSYQSSLPSSQHLFGIRSLY